MPDDPTPAGQAEASAPAPAPTPDIETIKAELRKEWDAEMNARVGGFQTVINQLTEENRQLKTSGLSEDELEQLANEEKDKRIAELETQVKLAEIHQQYPQVAEVYTKLLNATTEEQQAQILLSLVQPAAPAEPAAPAAPSDVDKNNPALTVGQIVAQMPDGTPITGDAAVEALKQLGPTPLAAR